MRRRLCIGMALVSAIGACGGGSAGSSGAAGTPAPVAAAGSSASSAAPARRGSANLITSAEITAGSFRDAYEIVERLRPQLLLSRGAGSPTPTVYQDNVSLGTPSSLRQIAATSVKEIRYINASDAATRWGTGNPGGVILVITVK